VAQIVFRLFIAGRTTRSERAIAHLRRLMDQTLAPYDCSLTVINVVEEPQLAEIERIIATPTLIKDLPLPSRRLIGDLSEIAELLDLLNLPPVEQGHDQP
jgi:circadian clock protein KaiB